MSSPAVPVPVAFCITELDPGGAEKAFVELVTRLDRARFQPHVICLAEPGALVDPLIQAGIPVFCLGRRGMKTLFALRRLTELLREIQPALLQCFLFQANLLGRLAGKRANIPIILSGIRVADRRGRWRWWLDRLTAGAVTCHVCVSQGVAEFARKELHLPPDKITVIPNGVQVSRFASAPPADLTSLNIPPEARVMLFVGRLEKQKGPDLLIRAAHQVLSEIPDVHLLIVGEGPWGSLLRKMAGAKLRRQIHFLGRRSDIPELMQSADGLMLPSRWEGMPNVVLEAMASGLPVIATEIEGIRELVRPGETGWIVPAGSAEALGAAWREWLTAPCIEMGRKAQHIVVKEFTWDQMAARYQKLYMQFLSHFS